MSDQRFRPIERGSIVVRARQLVGAIGEILRFIRDWPPTDPAKLSSASSIAELQGLVRHRRLHAFNGQIVRLKYVADLFNAVGCTAFLETGTRFGATALSAAYLLRTRVRSVEVNRNALRLARVARALTRQSGVEFVHGDSRRALRHWLTDPGVGARPMVYLDAHWLHEHPLRTEVEILLTSRGCVVVIDDAQVPHDPGFGYDHQEFGQASSWSFTVSLEAVSDLLPKERVIALLPGHSATSETGLRQGTLILLVDVPLPSLDPFTSTLFKPVPL